MFGKFSKKKNIITGAIFSVLAVAVIFAVLNLGGGLNKEKNNLQFSPNIKVESISSNDLIKNLKYPEYGFTFDYPSELKIKAFLENNGGETLIFKNPTGKERRGFQIFIVPFEEASSTPNNAKTLKNETILTPERIRQDLPSAIIEKPMEVLIGKDKNKQALIFFSEDPSIGKTREIWFIHKGNLFEISTYADLDAWIGPITETFKFF